MTNRVNTILHVCTRETILELRDQIFRLHGYTVDSTLKADDCLQRAKMREYDLVVIDVEGNGQVPGAEKLCTDIKAVRPKQEIAFICNYRVSIESDCPDEIIRSEFNPKAMIDGIKALLKDKS